MFGFLKSVGKEILDEAKGQGGQQQQGGYGPPQGQYGPPQGQYGPPQGQYGPPQGQYGGYGPPQGQYGGYGPPQDQYGPPQGQYGGYGPPQGQYGGYGPPQDQYGPPQGQHGGGAGLEGMIGMASSFLGKSGGHGGGGGGGSGMGGMASQFLGSMLQGGSGGHGGGSGHGGHGGQIGMLTNLMGGLMGSGGKSGGMGMIASNIIGNIIAPKISRNSDGTVDENLNAMKAPKRIYPNSTGLISSFFGKGGFKSRKGHVNQNDPGGFINPMSIGTTQACEDGTEQNFYTLRQQCLDEGNLFVDYDFPADDSSLYFSQRPPRNFEWKRPHEICDDPKLFSDGVSRFDVKQGELGDCWLLAAVANLTLSKRLFYQVVPSDQGFEDNYAGIFHFRFWQYGSWIDVVVDDLLPTSHGRLVFMHSEEHNEFWSALFEKAYAKLHGSYEALKGGTTCEAMEDFTGGVSEMYDLSNPADDLFNIMLKGFQRGSLMGCSMDPDPNEVEARCETGLVRGHAYSITCVKYFQIETPRTSGRIPLIRIRNPWGNEAEWNGAWSDHSQEWQYIPAHEREELGLTFEHDGEFWMSFQDFCQNFTMLEMTNLNPNTVSDEDVQRSVRHKWEMYMFTGEWVPGSTAGGCRNYLDTFCHNPQYIINLSEVVDGDGDNNCTMIVGLMQKTRRAGRKMVLECLTIGFAIYHIPDPGSVPRPLDYRFFRYNASIARSPTFINMREVAARFKLPPGTYCIVPSTFEPNDEGEFILRVFCENSGQMEENDEDVGVCQVDERVQEDEEQAAAGNERIRGFFNVVAGEDGEIDWEELQGVLNYSLKKEFDFDGFSKGICTSLVNMVDVDRSEKLDFKEFLTLWGTIKLWKKAFQLHDHQNTSQLSTFTLRQALSTAGFTVNNQVCNALIARYGDESGNISFDNYIRSAIKIKTLLRGNPDEERMDAFCQSLFEQEEEE